MKVSGQLQAQVAFYSGNNSCSHWIGGLGEPQNCCVSFKINFLPLWKLDYLNMWK